MKTALFALVLSLSSAPAAFAQTEGAALAQKWMALAAKIAASPASAAAALPDCSNAIPSGIMTAEASLVALGNAVDASVKVDGTQTLSAIYKPKLDALLAALTSSKLVLTDRQHYADAVTNMETALASNKRSIDFTLTQAPQTATPETARQDFAALNAMVTQVIADVGTKLQGGGMAQPLFQVFLTKWNALFQVIRTNNTRLNMAASGDFSAQLNAIGHTVCGSENPDTTGCAYPAPAANFLVISAAIAKLDALSAAVASAPATDRVALSVLYAPQIAALQQSVAAAKIDAKDLAALNQEILTFQTFLTIRPASVLAQTANAAAATPASAAAAYQKVSADVAAAVSLAKTQTDFASGLPAEIAALQAKVNTSPLNAQFKSDFQSKLTAAVLPAGCAYLQPKYLCGAASDAALAAAEKNLAALSGSVSTAIMIDGAKSLSTLYASKLAHLTATLEASKVDSADKAKLTARMQAFAAVLNTAATSTTQVMLGGVPLTAASAAEKFSLFKDDVQDAIDLASKH